MYTHIVFFACINYSGYFSDKKFEVNLFCVCPFSSEGGLKDVLMETVFDRGIETGLIVVVHVCLQILFLFFRPPD